MLTLRFWTFMTCIALAIIGACLALTADQLPEWSDAVRAQAIIMRNMPSDNVMADEASYRQYYHQWENDLNGVRTGKWPLFDAGVGMMALSVCLLLGTMLLGIHRRRDLIELKTPTQRWNITTLVVLAWICLWATGIAAVMQGFFRHEYPWWADTIIIPMFSFTVFAVVLSPVVALLVWRGALRGASLPASIWAWNHTGLVSWFWEFVWVAVVVAGIYLCITAMRLGPVVAIPTSLLFVYLGLVLRAAATREAAERRGTAVP